jgi:hypothetical protein
MRCRKNLHDALSVRSYQTKLRPSGTNPWEISISGCHREFCPAALSFTYSGQGVGDFGGTSSGSGSFAFADSPTSLGKGDLTSFTFSQTTTPPGRDASTFDYTLSDLTAFSATLTPGGLLTGLTLTTDAVSGSNPEFRPESFGVTSLATNGASTFIASGFQLQVGTVTPAATAAPEPASLTLLGLGSLGLLGYGWRRRKQPAS